MAKKGKPLKILVCAASGKLGRAIVADALDKDHSVAAIVRTGGGNSKPDLRVGRSDELADVHVGDAADQAFVSKTLASGPFDVVCVAVGAEAADVVTSVISAVAAAEPSPVLMMTGGAPALVACWVVLWGVASTPRGRDRARRSPATARRRPWIGRTRALTGRESSQTSTLASPGTRSARRRSLAGAWSVRRRWSKEKHTASTALARKRSTSPPPTPRCDTKPWRPLSSTSLQNSSRARKRTTKSASPLRPATRCRATSTAA
mmetsp:Transcript_32503/g.100594  ORF Transcript_32503/g.100594 Transcript_32503/m.100594 type:complete len:262 (+) Transcript_32503:412-1197(+)